MKLVIDPRVWEDLPEESKSEFQKLVKVMEDAAAEAETPEDFNEKMEELGFEPQQCDPDDPEVKIAEERRKNPIPET